MFAGNNLEPMSSRVTAFLPAEHPGANCKRDVENRKRQQRVRKNAGDSKRHQYRGNEHPSIEHRRGDDLSFSGTTAEQVEPANDCNRHAKSAFAFPYACISVIET